MRPRRDPAPSRLAYRIDRLMLTPSFRRFLRHGLPLLALLAAGAWWAADEDRRVALADRVAELRREIEARPEFRVAMMRVDGASAAVEREIRAALPIDFPVSSFDLDLDAIQTEVAALAPVRAASVRLSPGGILDLRIDERQPALVWRHDGRLVLLDAEGVELGEVMRREDRARLPLLAGAGASGRVDEALRLFAVAEPVAARLRGLVRVGERRWDLVLDRGQRVMLPETAPLLALDKVMALHAAQDLLARDVTRIDMRNPERPVLRLGETALMRLRGAATAEDDGG